MLRLRSITGHLLVFALCLALPILVMAGTIAWAYLRQEAARVDDLADRQVAQIVSRLDSRLAAYRAMLDLLAVDPSVLEGDLPELRARLQNIALPQDVWLTVRDRAGQQLLNTARPVGEPLPAFAGRGDPTIFNEGRPYTSDLIWAPVTQQWAVTLSVPVRVPVRTGDVRYALSAAIPAAHLQQIVADVPKGWIAAINDRAGTIVARSLSHDQWVGKAMARTGWEVTKDVPPGQGGHWRNIYSLEGAKVVGAYHRMASTGWLIGVSALPEIYQGPRQHILMLGSGLAVAALLLAALLAFALGRRITAAIGVLQVKAAAMRDMRVIDVPRTSLDEINAVAGIMGATAGALQERQAQQTTMMQELNHRVKNTLATIQSISRMTLRSAGDLRAFEEGFMARLLALSETHNLLTERGWSGVDLRTLLATELKPFQTERLALYGPAVYLSSKIAVALGMAVHELATNAAKYGAWQGTAGQVHVRWTVADGILTMDWREVCAGKIAPPTRAGFGSRLIRQTVSTELQGGVDMQFREDGLHCLIKIPLSVTDRLELGERTAVEGPVAAARTVGSSP